MKTLPGTCKAVILLAIGAAAILSFRVLAEPKPVEPPASKATFVLKVKNTTYVKDADRFKDVLKHLKTQLYDVVLEKEDGTQEHLVPGHSAKLDIKTDKVTASESAKNASTDGNTRNPGNTRNSGSTPSPGATRNPGRTRNPCMTRNIASMDLSDIKTVLDELQQ
jgi:hypothetical protein